MWGRPEWMVVEWGNEWRDGANITVSASSIIPSTFIISTAILTQSVSRALLYVVDLPRTSRACLPRTTDLDQGMDMNRVAVARVGTLALQVMHPTIYEDKTMLIPRDDPPYDSKQFSYYMNGILQGELILSSAKQVQFRSYRTKYLSLIHISEPTRPY